MVRNDVCIRSHLKTKKRVSEFQIFNNQLGFNYKDCSKILMVNLYLIDIIYKYLDMYSYG